MTPVAKLQAIVAIPTVAGPDPARDSDAEFTRLREVMAELWPRVHALETSDAGRHGLLARWPGRSRDKPVVLMAHLDVVPVVDAHWSHDPFGGEVRDGSVWGRGTLDDKGCVAAICEAVEGLLADGEVPAQDVWLSFGANEETSGGDAREAVAILAERKVAPWLVLDEGGAVAHDAFPGVTAPVAVIGVAEKGTTSLRLTATGNGGHASTPARGGPAVRLARAITRLEAAPMPPRLPAPALELLRRLAPHAPAPLRAVLGRANRPLVSAALGRLLALAGPEAAALARTTMAVTTLEGSPALNVIPAAASAGVNVRVLPGDSVASVVRHARAAIRDPSVGIEVIERGEPSPVSRYDDAPFALVTDVIAEVFGDAVPAPYVTLAATDSRFFPAISDHVYRFAPLRMTRAQRAAIHAADEHIGTDDFTAGIAWYRRLLQRLPA
jgi:carboxypeptidase PM20D1